MAKNKKIAAKALRKKPVNPPLVQCSHGKSSELAAKTIRRSLRIADKFLKLENVQNESLPKKSGKRTAVTAATIQNELNVEPAKFHLQRRNETTKPSTQATGNPSKKVTGRNTKRTSEPITESMKVPAKNARKSTALPITIPSRPYEILDLTAFCETLIFSNGTLRTSVNTSTAQASKPSPNASPTKSNEVLKCITRIRKRRPSVQIRSVQPLIRQRTVPIAKDISNFQRAKVVLHLSAVQKSLPCREKEFTKIFEVMKSKLLDNSGGCMYVSGVPGSGKSATVAEVIRSLQLQSDDDKNAIPSFELIQVNGMHLTEPQQAYVHIWHHLSGETIRWDDAVSFLDQFFVSKRRKLTILVVDEFDMLKSPRQRVIYNLLNWAMMQSARLFVVAIGNIVDVDRMGGIASRLGATRFTFQPYTQSQLLSIVRARLAGINIYENDAIELVARKVASISGDCRRALDICRRAIEIGEKKECIDKTTGLVITMSHVMEAFDEMVSSNLKVTAIKGCSKYEKLFLQAVAAEIRRTGTDETVFYQVYRQFEAFCLLNGAPVAPEPGIALRISSRLGASRLLLCDHSNNSIHRKIVLNVTGDEIQYAYN